jgi:hypothetical protein
MLFEKERRSSVAGSRKNENEPSVCIKGQFLSSRVVMRFSGKPMFHKFINIGQSSQTIEDVAS